MIYTVPVSHIPSEALKSDELLHLIHSDQNKQQNPKLVTFLFKLIKKNHVFEEETITDVNLKPDYRFSENLSILPFHY